MELIRVFVTVTGWSISILGDVLQWAGFDLVSKAMSRAEQSALRPTFAMPPGATFCPGDTGLPRTAVGGH